MGMIADLFVKLGLKSDDYTKGLDKAKKETSSFGSSLKTVGAAIAGAFSVAAIMSFGKAALQEFIAAEKGAIKLLTALNGNIFAQKKLLSQAQELQNTTLFEDDETVAAQAALAVMIKDEEQIRILIPLIQDLATAKGIDLVTAANAVGKAVATSGAGLQRMGIQTEGVAGSAERFTSVVKALNSAVGGQSVAAANASTSALAKLSLAYRELKESIGRSIGTSKWFKYEMDNLKEMITVFQDETLSGWKKFWLAFGVEGDAIKAWREKNKILASLPSEADMPESSRTEKPKILTQAEQISARIKFLRKEIADVAIGMQSIDPTSEEWKTSADEIKKYKDELNELTGATKSQTKANDDLIDRLILQRIEEQKILELQGKQLPGQLTPRGGGPVKSTIATPAIAGLGGLTKAKESEAAGLKMANDQILENEARFQDDLYNIISNGMANAIESFAGGLADLAAGNITGKQFGQQVLGMVGSFMVQLGMLMITTSSLYTKWIASLSNPVTAVAGIGLGIALVVAGAAVSALAKKGPGGGGYSSGGGSYTQSGYQGATGSKAQGMNGNVYFEIQGSKLVGVLANTATSKRLQG